MLGCDAAIGKCDRRDPWGPGATHGKSLAPQRLVREWLVWEWLVWEWLLREWLLRERLGP